MNKSGIIYINLPNDIIFKVLLVNLENTKYIHIRQTNELFKISIDKPNFVYKNIPFYVLINGLPKQIILSKCIIKSLKNKLDKCEI